MQGMAKHASHMLARHTNFACFSIDFAVGRPCQRCVKRDLAATCADGVRKKAKYLQDSYDAQQLAAEQAGQSSQGNNGSSSSSSSSSIDLTGMDQQLLSDQDQQQRQGMDG